MILDLRKDSREIHKFLAQRTKDYLASEAKTRGPISAGHFTYEYGHGGWLTVHFDNRPEHKRDGETGFSKKDYLKRANWFAAEKALCYFTTAKFDPHWGIYGRVIKKKPVTIILPDGTRKNAINITEKTYSAMLGKLLKHVALSAKKKKLFSKLPRHPICHIDIEEFNGSWAWPALEKFSKASRI